MAGYPFGQFAMGSAYQGYLLPLSLLSRLHLVEYPK